MVEEMARLVKTFSLDPEQLSTYDDFSRIIRKDKKIVLNGRELEARSVSEAFSKFMEFYVKAHTDNPIPRLDKWSEDPTYRAFPTLGDIPPAFDELAQKFPERADLQAIKNNAHDWEVTVDLALKLKDGRIKLKAQEEEP